MTTTQGMTDTCIATDPMDDGSATIMERSGSVIERGIDSKRNEICKIGKDRVHLVKNDSNIVHHGADIDEAIKVYRALHIVKYLKRIANRHKK